MIFSGNYQPQEPAMSTKAKHPVDTSTQTLPTIEAPAAELSSPPAQSEASASLAATVATAQGEDTTKKTRNKPEFLTVQDALVMLSKILQKVDPTSPLFLKVFDAMQAVRS